MENEGHRNFSSDKRVREVDLVLYKKEELQERVSIGDSFFILWQVTLVGM